MITRTNAALEGMALLPFTARTVAVARDFVAIIKELLLNLDCKNSNNKRQKQKLGNETNTEHTVLPVATIAKQRNPTICLQLKINTHCTVITHSIQTHERVFLND